MGRYSEKNENAAPGGRQAGETLQGRTVALALILAVLLGVLGFIVYKSATAQPYAPISPW